MAALKSGAAISGGTRMAYSMSKAASGEQGVRGIAAGVSGVAKAGVGKASNAAKRMVSPIKDSFQSGSRNAVQASGGQIVGGAANDPKTGAPDWAKRSQGHSASSHAGVTAFHALRDGDRGGASQGPHLQQDEE
jgi:type IV secretion system protein TrbL